MSEIRVNNIIDEAGTGAPTFPNGATGNLTGNVTGNCSGTAGSLAAGATGSDLTLSGNLTVNGTTTTIDTAVTAVDSLAVDGNITALGRLGIGTDNTSADVLTVSGVDAFIRVDRSNGNPGIDLRYQGSSTNRAKIDVTPTGDLRFAAGGGTERLRIDQHGTTKFKGPLVEKCHYDTGGGLQSDYHHDLITHGNVYWSDTAAAGAFTFNLRGSATVALNDMMSTGESLSFWFAHACHSDTTRYMTAFKVDGNTISGGNIIWSGGSAPTAAGGGSGTKDVYTFTVFKVGNASFRAFAAQTNHA